MLPSSIRYATGIVLPCPVTVNYWKNIVFSLQQITISMITTGLSFEKDNIRNLIIHKRKLQLIADMEKAAMAQAVKANEVEIFMKKQE